MPTLLSPSYCRLLINPLSEWVGSFPNASEKPIKTHRILTRAKATNVRVIMEIKFFLRTSPPEENPTAVVISITSAVEARTHAVLQY